MHEAIHESPKDLSIFVNIKCLVLIKAGADLNSVDEDNNTLLHCAVNLGNYEITKVLLENGANVNAQGRYNQTPIHCATLNGHVEIIELLVNYGADIDMKSDKNLTPLHLAVKKNAVEVVEKLIALGANLEEKDNNELTPLHIAVWLGQMEMVDILVRSGANLNTKGFDNFTPIITALIHGPHFDIIEKLLKEGAAINSRTKRDLTFLHFATMYGLKSLCTLSIVYKADLNAASRSKITPLHYAVHGNDLEIVQILLRNGANPNVKDKDGDSLIEYALKKKNIGRSKNLLYLYHHSPMK